MEFLSQWVTNIILFILLAIVIDLLVPNSSMQRYVKMVIGLLLIVVILTPIFNIFNKDIDDLLKGIDMTTAFQEKNIKNSIEYQKKEIQASQRAYILEQVAVQMKKKVEEDLQKNYETQITHIQLSFKKDANTYSFDEISHVKVEMQEKTKKQQITNKLVEVERIMVDTSIPLKEDEDITGKQKEIRRFLAKQWEIPEESIVLYWKEG